MDAVDHAIEVAHMVTVSTEPLAEVLRQRHPKRGGAAQSHR
jgi:hypothetical protein